MLLLRALSHTTSVASLRTLTGSSPVTHPLLFTDQPSLSLSPFFFNQHRYFAKQHQRKAAALKDSTAAPQQSSSNVPPSSSSSPSSTSSSSSSSASSSSSSAEPFFSTLNASLSKVKASAAFWGMKHPILMSLLFFATACSGAYWFRKTMMSDNVQIAIIRSVAAQSDMLKKHLLVESADEFSWSPMPTLRMQGDVQVVEYGVSGNHQMSCVLIGVFDINNSPPKLVSLSARFRGPIAEGDLGVGFTIVGDQKYLEQQQVLEAARKRLIQSPDVEKRPTEPDEEANLSASEIAARIREDRVKSFGSSS